MTITDGSPPPPAPPPPSSGRGARKSGPRRKRDEPSLSNDARRVEAAVLANAGPLIAADTKLATPLVTRASIREFGILVAAAPQTSANATTRRAAVSRATVLETKLRAALHQASRDIIEDLESAYPTGMEILDAETRKTFFAALGVGTRRHADLTDSVLQEADALIEQFDEKAHGRLMRNGGIEKKQIDALRKLRESLAAADTSQNALIKLRGGATMDREEFFDKLTKMTTMFRRRARSVFKRNAKILKQFESTIAKAKMRKPAKKK